MAQYDPINRQDSAPGHPISGQRTGKETSERAANVGDAGRPPDGQSHALGPTTEPAHHEGCK